MLALSPPLFSNFEWTFEDLISHHEQDNIETSDSLLHYPSLWSHDGHGESTYLGGAIEGDAMMAKKLNHNASERDRRKRVNNLYSFLRSLLPAADQTKKISIPGTVSRTLKYIPELQKEVEILIHKKQKLLSSISSQEDLHIKNQSKDTIRSPQSAVSVSLLGDKEVVIQISTINARKSLLSEAFKYLEEDGLLLLNAFTLKSFGERIFNSLHFQVQGNHQIQCEMVREKLLLFCPQTEL